MALSASVFGADNTKRTAAVIGHTGAGDYGHGHELIFSGRNDVNLVALADADEAGRKKALERTGATRGYADWREMLANERPELVSIAPRWTVEHFEIAKASLAAGAHLYVEKPFTTTLAQADELLLMAKDRGLRIAVAHQVKLAPSIVFLKNRIEEGLIGELIEIRAWGKQDARAGGEDMMVLGTHLFDLMRLFAGDAAWCSARVVWKGRDITIEDAREPSEKIGVVAGDEVEAQFAFGNGVMGSFVSRGRLRESVGHWGIELVGSKGSARILMDIWPRIMVARAGKWEDAGRTDEWKRVDGDPGLTAPAAERSTASANKRVVDDWLAAIRDKREPACSAYSAMKAIEMVMSVYESALSKGRVELPLKKRAHPLMQ